MVKLISSELFQLTNLIYLLTLLTGLYGILPPNEQMKTWTYELKSVTTKTSDPDKLKIDLEIIRISRGVHAISGTIFIGGDIKEGDSNYISANWYRSSQGDYNYKLLPFQMHSAHVYDIMNTYYKDTIMDSIRNCSDLPVFENRFVPPLEKRTYKMERCQISHEGFPNHLQEGFYEILTIGTGDVEYEIEIIVEVISIL
ncbi:uncharacterized protein ACRADG_007026 [Cochliomyia hominivorax]